MTFLDIEKYEKRRARQLINAIWWATLVIAAGRGLVEGSSLWGTLTAMAVAPVAAVTFIVVGRMLMSVLLIGMCWARRYW